MTVLILRSRKPQKAAGPRDPYTQQFTSSFADKVLGNLKGEEGFCTACGPDCNACRKPYGRKLADRIAGVRELPGQLPYLLERPGRYVPRKVPPHEIILAVNIHEQVLVEVLKRCRRWGTRGAVVPLEAPDWVSGAARKQAESVCQAQGLELAFPKPFCSFDPPAGSVLADFRREFHIGKPDVALTVRDGAIAEARVNVSAACGATYYVARWLVGKRVDDDLKYEVVAKRMHSYPCTASMKWDDEIGDTPMHVASQAHYEILTPLTGEARDAGTGMVMSPVGIMLPKPPRAHENVQNIERAKQAILEALATEPEVSLKSLRRSRKLSPAALSSAALLLRQAGKIRTKGDKIARA